MILCHIAGPSGSGKTTLLKKINESFPAIITKDLDEFDEDASARLGLDSAQKKHWEDGSFLRLAELRQRLMDEFTSSHNDKVIVLAGFHTEGKHVLHVPTSKKFLLDTSAEESARRAYKRSQSEKPEHRRSLEDLPLDAADAQRDIDFLIENGYEKISAEKILAFISNTYAL